MSVLPSPFQSPTTGVAPAQPAGLLTICVVPLTLKYQ